MSHNPAVAFQVKDRGFIREGYFADLALVNLKEPWTVEKENIAAKCKWSPFEGQVFMSKVKKTWVSGHLAYDDGKFDEALKGQRLVFSRS